jgi:hypothetical protein
MSAGVGLAMQAGSSVLGAVGQYQSMRQGAAIDTENARLTELDGALQGDETARANRQEMGSMLAAMGGSGASIGSGSALDIIEQAGVEQEFEILDLRNIAAQKASNLRFEAKQKKKAAVMALIGGLMGAGGQAAAGISGMKNQSALLAANRINRASQLPRETGTGIPLPKRHYIGAG